MNLKQENTELKRKLQIAESWMQKEVQGQIHNLSKKHLREQSSLSCENFISEEMEDIITTKIQSFFSDTPLYDIPQGFLENIVKSEVGYYILQKWIGIDNLVVTIGYQKCLESIIEYMITAPFRTWAQKNISPTKSCSPLEDSLKKVIEKKYMLWIGKLYHTLTHTESGAYQKGFEVFISQNTDLKNTLLQKGFLVQLQQVVESEVFGNKRHSGEISIQEVDMIRLLCTGNLTSKDCLIHTLFSTQSII